MKLIMHIHVILQDSWNKMVYKTGKNNGTGRIYRLAGKFYRPTAKSAIEL